MTLRAESSQHTYAELNENAAETEGFTHLVWELAGAHSCWGVTVSRRLMISWNGGHNGGSQGTKSMWHTSSPGWRRKCKAAYLPRPSNVSIFAALRHDRTRSTHPAPP